MITSPDHTRSCAVSVVFPSLRLEHSPTHHVVALTTRTTGRHLPRLVSQRSHGPTINMATPAPSSAPVPRSRSQSPPAASSSAPSEITSLLPSSSSRPRTATAHPAAAPRPDPRVHAAARKVSVDTRSVAGSVRGYGTVPPGRPSPSEQAPRVSKLGQRASLFTIRLKADRSDRET